jgi:hypothetical protein
MGYSLIANSTQKAKKEHRCTWCGQQILVGDEYVRIRGVFEGEPQTDKLHPECDDAASEYFREWGADEGYSPYENERPEKVTANNGRAES